MVEVTIKLRKFACAITLMLKVRAQLLQNILPNTLYIFMRNYRSLNVIGVAFYLTWCTDDWRSK